MNSLKNKLMQYGIMAVIGIAPLVSFAALPEYNPNMGPIENVGEVKSLITSISGVVFWLLMSLSIIMVIYAAFLYITAAGDSEKVGKANQTLTYAVVGIAVALLASGVPALVQSIIGATT